MNCSHYVAPPLSLVKKKTKLRWTAELQQAFETLREKFANCISWVHPVENLPFCIYTDASNIAISAIMLRVDEAAATLRVFTAAHALSPTEQRRNALLAIVHALHKFRF